MLVRLRPSLFIALLAACFVLAGCGGSSGSADSPFESASLTTRVFEGFNIGEPVPNQIGTGSARVLANGQFSGNHTITSSGETQTLVGTLQNDGQFSGTLTTENGVQSVSGLGAIYTDSSGFRLDVRDANGTPLITLDIRYN